MKETRFFYVPDAANVDELPAEEATHAVRVLRLKPGDDIMLIDGKGSFYEAQVSMATSHHCFYTVRRQIPQLQPWKGHLHLAIAPTKMAERMEWLVEKATEIGINEISFLDCQNSERHQLKTARLEKIAVSAIKQSRKAWMPVVNDLAPFSDFLNNCHAERCFIAHCYPEIPRVNLFDELRRTSTATADSLVLIGPEGDFSMPEVRQALAAGFVSVDLGESRLRTETAGLSAVMMMHLAQR